ncbi:glutathione synthase [Cystobasidium minutum MCA 4210]|uniref:glutathione synthase n=1 Tax=Cystobasidium minutum MCA 4210 TaxID=1397322 RepID=UPI0034CDB28E|eukprot:jgi/Rhomi1/153421/estExt_Genewise1.C_4_t30488
MSSTQIPDWPPSTASEQEQADLLHSARDWALSHALVYRPPLQSSVDTDTAFHTSVIHAPFALYPSPFPRQLFDLAVDIQTTYSELYARISTDFDFLEQVIGGNVSKVDSFQGELWKIAKAVREEGLVQNIHLGLFRSDYLLHVTGPEGPLELKQVEFNTISSSFGALSNKVTDLHRYLAFTGAYPETSRPRITPNKLPHNVALRELARGLAEAHEAYGKSKTSKVLFVVQDPERNAFDQRALEYELLEKHGIYSTRRSFAQLHAEASLSSAPTRELFLTSPSSPNTSTEISVVYFRAGYTPSDYPTAVEWDTRTLIERSRAIKCPSVALQLSGAKKVQQVLTEPGVLERFIADDEYRLEKDELVTTFMKLYPMDESPLGKEALKLAYSHPERFVLKPQREGGGNNIYKQDIPAFLDKLEKEDQEKLKQSAAHGNKKMHKVSKEPKSREAYILMELIEPPAKCRNAMVRANEAKPRIGDVVSELGIYGVCLYEDTSTPVRTPRASIDDSSETSTNTNGAAARPALIDVPEGRSTTPTLKHRERELNGSIRSNKPNHSARILRNKNAGHLLRTKGRESDEGGVAVGFSVIDSPLLID